MALTDEKHVVLTVAGSTSRARVVPLSDGRLALCPDDDVATDGQPVSLATDDPGSPAVVGTAAANVGLTMGSQRWC